MKKLFKLSLISLFFVTTPVYAISKEESVYAKLENNGKVKTIVVEEHLKNDEQKDIIDDVSNLKDIYNTNGDEKFDKVGNKLKWHSNGKDIYYEGKTDKELPISISVKYELDNKEMQLKDMIGKKGKVKITINYINNEKHDNLYTPFLITTSTIIDGKNNTNINISNGKVISTGSKNILVGLSLPGLTDSLQVNTPINLDKTVITYETTKFESSEIYMVATPKLIDKEDLSILNNTNTLYGTLAKVSEATNKLEEGSKQLKTGINTYTEKMNEYNAGMNKLSDGSKTMLGGYNTLSNGISTLNSKMPTLKYGTKTIVDNLGLLKENVDNLNTSTNTIYTNNTKILGYLDDANSKVSVEDLTTAATNISNKAQAIDTKKQAIEGQITVLIRVRNKLTDEEDVQKIQAIIDGLESSKTELDTEKASLNTLSTQLSGLATYAGTVKTLSTNLNQVNNGLKTLNDGTNTLATSVTTFNEKGKEYQSQIDMLADSVNKLDYGNKQIKGGLTTLDESIKTLSNYSNQLNEGAKSINDGANKLNEGIEEFNKSINSVVSIINSKAKNIESKVRRLLDLSNQYETFTMKENNIKGSTKFIMVIEK